jgi:hypothetical protein
MRKLCALLSLGTLILLFHAHTLMAQWPEWALNAQHTGNTTVVGQTPSQTIVDIFYDPLVPQEQYWSGGDLLVHYQTPLADGNDVYMVFKSGSFNPHSYATEVFSEKKLSWSGNQLLTSWTFTSDWVPPGSLNSCDFYRCELWEPVFHPALNGNYAYIPGGGGSLYKVNKSDGSVAKKISPFTSKSNTFVVSPITVDATGNVYYNVLQLSATGGNLYDSDARDSWLVKVDTNDKATFVSYQTLTPNAPKPKDNCYTQFAYWQVPWPPSPNAVPPTMTCGTVRVALNAAPAVAPDGTIYSVSRSHFNERYGFLVAANPNLTPKWSASLRDRFNDGCWVYGTSNNGSILPPNGFVGGCRYGNYQGVDPATNRPGGGRVNDSASSSPTIAPDGSILYGVHTRYNYDQGHLMHFDSSGNYLGAYNMFGWDTTPAIYSHDGTWSVVEKENHYGGVGSYCNDSFWCPSDRSQAPVPEGYFITQLDKNLDQVPEWQFQNTNITPSNPYGYEWCVNAPVVDAHGTVYANSEDGRLYAVPQGGASSDYVFQQLAIGAAYTPTSLGPDGRIYTQNDGHLFVAVGTPTKYVFVTSGTLDGNMGGTAGGDAKCQAEAQAANLPGTYRAWLSSAQPGDNPAASFSHVNARYVTPGQNQAVVANSWAAFASAAHSADINVHADGSLLSDNWVWTGTNVDGTPSLNNCNGWTTNVNYVGGDYGDAQWPSDNYNSFNWSNAVPSGSQNANCAAPQNIYCVQQ